MNWGGGRGGELELKCKTGYESASYFMFYSSPLSLSALFLSMRISGGEGLFQFVCGGGGVDISYRHCTVQMSRQNSLHAENDMYEL